MGRKRTRLDLSAAQRVEAHHLLHTTTDRRELERLQFAFRAASGQHTLGDLARTAGRARSTIQNWLGKFAQGGLAGLLERDSPPGTVSPLAEPKIQAQLDAGLSAGRWRSAAHIAAWLNHQHGVQRARKSIYYWLQKNGWRAPRAKHQGP